MHIYIILKHNDVVHLIISGNRWNYEPVHPLTRKGHNGTDKMYQIQRQTANWESARSKTFKCTVALV